MFYTLGPGDSSWTGPIDLGLNVLAAGKRFAFAIEDLKIIRQNSNYYQVEEAFNTVYRANASDLAPFVGDMILVEEVPSRLWRLHWNGSTFEVSLLAAVTHGTDQTYFEQGNFDEGDCAPPPPPGNGATRTWGFWKTHLDIFSQALAGNCINLGSLVVTPAQGGGPNEVLANPTIGQVEAIFWTSPGKGTTDVGAARLALAHQLIAALANSCFVGTQPSDPNLLANAVVALDGTNTALMNALAGQLDAFNTSGDGITLPNGLQEGGANPNGAKALATSTGPAFK